MQSQTHAHVLNPQQVNDETPLMFVAEHGDVEITTILSDKGADQNITDKVKSIARSNFKSLYYMLGIHKMYICMTGWSNIFNGSCQGKTKGGSESFT